MNQHLLSIADQRRATGRLQWLTLHAPELARGVRAGQYMLARCAGTGSHDPLLRRALFVAAAEEALGQVGLLYEPSERGLAWLARGRPGDTIDLLGPFGQPFELDRRTRTLLLVGQGPGLAALLLLARQAAARGLAVTLLAGAAADDLLPPPFLLPDAVEYHSVIGDTVTLLGDSEQADKQTKRAGDKKADKNLSSSHSSPPLVAPSPLISWADQVCAALPDEQVGPLRDAVRQTKYQWPRGFASVLLQGPLICGVGACGVCALETRRGTRMLCSDGPVFDLRDVEPR